MVDCGSESFVHGIVYSFFGGLSSSRVSRAGSYDIQALRAANCDRKVNQLPDCLEVRLGYDIPCELMVFVASNKAIPVYFFDYSYHITSHAVQGPHNLYLTGIAQKAQAVADCCHRYLLQLPRQSVQQPNGIISNILQMTSM